MIAHRVVTTAQEPSSPADELGHGTVEEDKVADKTQMIEDGEEDAENRERVNEESNKVSDRNDIVWREDFNRLQGLVEDLVRIKTTPKSGVAVPTPPLSSPIIEQHTKAPPERSQAKECLELGRVGAVASVEALERLNDCRSTACMLLNCESSSHVDLLLDFGVRRQDYV
ncbi:hypothetical protein BDV93DRAFT_508710 [Ceratobasidium sp. AG-I]|nr:hypothetical protein BDV93DRAFT_508710 [Ceratobasidium sp. AG-I]